MDRQVETTVVGRKGIRFRGGAWKRLAFLNQIALGILCVKLHAPSHKVESAAATIGCVSLIQGIEIFI